MSDQKKDIHQRSEEAIAKNRKKPTTKPTIKHSADTEAVEEVVDVVSQNGDKAVNAIKTGIKFIPSTRGKLFVSAAVTGVGLGLMLRYFALDTLERQSFAFYADRAEKAAHHIQSNEAS